MLRFHRERGTSVTWLVEVPSGGAALQVQVDKDGRLTGFLEAEEPAPGEPVLASLGIYTSTWTCSCPRSKPMRRNTTTSAGHHSGLIDKIPVCAYRFYDENRRPRSSGATSERSTHALMRTWISAT
jgi:ADP-glucose pyrophosphorylase